LSLATLRPETILVFRESVDDGLAAETIRLLAVKQRSNGGGQLNARAARDYIFQAASGIVQDVIETCS